MNIDSRDDLNRAQTIRNKKKAQERESCEETSNTQIDIICPLKEITLKLKKEVAYQRKDIDWLSAFDRRQDNYGSSIGSGVYGVFAGPRGGKSTFLNYIRKRFEENTSLYNILEPIDPGMRSDYTASFISISDIESAFEAVFNDCRGSLVLLDSLRFAISYTGYSSAQYSTPTVYNLLLTSLNNLAIKFDMCILAAITTTNKAAEHYQLMEDIIVGSCAGCIIPTVQDDEITINVTSRYGNRNWFEYIGREKLWFNAVNESSVSAKLKNFSQNQINGGF